MKIRWLAILFSIFIASIIILADVGYLKPLLWMIHEVKNLDKVLHFLLIGTLTYLISAGLIESLPNRNVNWIVLVAMFSIFVFFTIEELSQSQIRGRSFSLIDLAANYLGIFVFGFLAWFRYRKIKR